MNVQPFSPQVAGTVTVSATASNASTTLASTAPNAAVVRIVNKGPNTVFILLSFGAGTAAVATSFPMLSGTVEVFSKGPADTINTICAAAETATVYATCGEGQ